MRHVSTHLIVVLTLITTPFAVHAAGEPTPMESRITHVTVYPEWAYVTRTAQINLQPGQTRLSLEQLPAWIDSESMRVRVSVPDKITILGVATETTYLTRSTQQQVNDAEDALTAWRDQMEDLEAELAVLEQERAYLKELHVYAVDKTPKDAAVRQVSVEEMAEVQSYLKEQRLQNVREQTALRRQMRERKPELAAAEKVWNDLKGRVRLEQKRIVLDLDTTEATQVTIDVSYLISGASWYPTYDARTSSNNGQVELTCQAIVQQSTGEDWSNATFVLSTIQPYLSREKPELNPWYINQGLDNGSYKSDGLFGRSSNVIASKRLANIQQRQRESNRYNRPQAIALEQVLSNTNSLARVIRKIEERGTTVEFAIAGTHSVSTDGKPTAIRIGQTSLDATRHYSAAPAVSAATYVTGKMRHAGSFPILPGEVRIYTDGSFTAKSDLPFVAQNEKFELFLGLDERIKVTRELDYSKSSTTSWSNKQRLSAAYIITVKNYLDRDVMIDISDQVPVSQNKEIVVKLESTEPSTDHFEKGILTWPITLAASETKTLRFAFRIDSPEAMQLDAIKTLRGQIMAQ